MASLSSRQQETVRELYAAAREAGLYGPQADLAVVQAIHETGWGRSPSGRNNYHGIKDFSGKGTLRTTWEVEDGRRVNRREPFKNFDSLTDSFRGWKGLMERVYPDVMKAFTLDEAIKGLNIGVAGKPNYATDPAYNQKLSAVGELIGPYGSSHPAALNEFVRQTELNAGIGGLLGGFGQPVGPGLLEGFDIVSNTNLSGVPTPSAKPGLEPPTPATKPGLLGGILDKSGELGKEVIRAGTMREPEYTPSEGPLTRSRVTGVGSPVGRTAPVSPVEQGSALPDLIGGRIDQGFDALQGRTSTLDLGPSVGYSASASANRSPGAQASYAAQVDLPSRSYNNSGQNPATGYAPGLATEQINPSTAYTGGAISPVDIPGSGILSGGFDVQAPGTPNPTTTAGLLGALGVDDIDIPGSGSYDDLPSEDVIAPAVQQPVQQSLPPLEAPRTISSRAAPQGFDPSNVRTVTGAVPEVAQKVGEYGLPADPGGGYSYGFSPYGSGIAKVHANAPDRVRTAATGPGLFGAFKDEFGVDLTPGVGTSLGPLAMAGSLATGAPLGLGLLGAKVTGLDKKIGDYFDLVPSDQRAPSVAQTNSGGGLLGDFFGNIGGLFGGGSSAPAGYRVVGDRLVSNTSGSTFNGSVPTPQSKPSDWGGSGGGGGFFGGIGDFIGGLLGGGYDSGGSRTINDRVY